jgi:hypothetical protein
MPRILSLGVCVLLLLVIAGGCQKSEEQESGEQVTAAIPTPQMPSEWKVVDDFLVTASELKQFSSKMNADLVGVRNTAFDVEGLRVQVNTVVASSPTDAEHVMEFMRSIKSDQALLQRGTTVYEFVGTSEVNHLIPVGREHLSKASM